jgi:hypothetical protein
MSQERHVAHMEQMRNAYKFCYKSEGNISLYVRGAYRKIILKQMILKYERGWIGCIWLKRGRRDRFL